MNPPGVQLASAMSPPGRQTRANYGPTLRAFESLDPPRRESLRDGLLALARRYDRNGGTGPIAITGDYLETVIVRR